MQYGTMEYYVISEKWAETTAVKIYTDKERYFPRGLPVTTAFLYLFDPIEQAT